MDELDFEVKLFVKLYRWRRVSPTPWTPLPRPLSECKLALISSAALIPPGVEPFGSQPGGDVSFREVPSDLDPATLIDCHPSHHFDHSGLTTDRNLAFPIDRVRELVACRRIGAVNHRHLSLCGAITAPGRLIKRTAPEAVRWLVEDGVDVALLVPV
jgi:D-proline reductase (dithiol) PrdB